MTRRDFVRTGAGIFTATGLAGSIAEAGESACAHEDAGLSWQTDLPCGGKLEGTGKRIGSSPDPPDHPWSAYWIACSGALQREFGVYFFRKSFSLDGAPARFVIHASGDNRYQLFVNGARILWGPAKGDLFHWRYETLDIARYLRGGKNTLAAVVWNFAEQAPVAQMTNETGFILQGDGSEAGVADTNSSWRVQRSDGFEMIPIGSQTHHEFTVVGPGERIDAALYPWGWQKTDFDDSGWQHALELAPGGLRGLRVRSRWMLVSRNIPFMEASLVRLVRIRRYQGPASFHPTDAFLQGHSPLSIPPHSRVTLLLDQSYETTGYSELVTSGGRGSAITLTYAEALFDRNHQKGDRNVIKGKTIEGYTDQFLPDGGENRVFRPLWWRAYRYLQIEARTGEEALVLKDFRGEFTGYPLHLGASFQCDDPALENIFQAGWRTARLCAHETYMDCPYYEQLQYAGDTRIQGLISLYLSGDDRLVKNAIDCLNASRTSEGLTQSRYPSFMPQYIPPFSLFWIGMMRDLWWYHGEANFLRQFLPNARDVLGWFESQLTPSGLLGDLPWWAFVDWTEDFNDGVPAQESDGQSSILSLQFAVGLREAADLESAMGSAARASRDRALAAHIAQAVYKTCWDPHRMLLADTPARRHFSQHANIMGVLAAAIPKAYQKKVTETILNDRTLTQCSYYFRFYLFGAMKKAGLGDEYIRQLKPWRHMLSLGLTTFAEKPEPARSDCHAWSAHPCFGLLATVAGIEPAAPGFREVVLAPHLGHLKELRASMPLPQGEISLLYRRNKSHLAADVTLPEGLNGSFYWEGIRRPLRGGTQHLTF